MEIIFTILGALFIGIILSIIIIILMQHFNISLEDKNACLVPTIVIAVALLFSCYRSTMRDKEIKKIIDTSNTVEEIQEKTQKYFDPDYEED